MLRDLEQQARCKAPREIDKRVPWHWERRFV